LGGTKTIPLCIVCHSKVHGKDFVKFQSLARVGIKRYVENGGKLGRKVGTKESNERFMSKPINQQIKGLVENGTLDTIDIEEELVDFQRKYFDASPWKDQIFQHLGDAVDIIPTLNKKFDLVFIDADKENYVNYFHLIVPMMNKGGIILSDNVLWSGKVLEEVKPNDKSTPVLLEYNQLLNTDPRVETVLLPIRDGLTVSRVL
jgi:hypothetical protein